MESLPITAFKRGQKLVSHNGDRYTVVDVYEDRLVVLRGRSCYSFYPNRETGLYPVRIVKPRAKYMTRRSFRCAGADEDSVMRFGRSAFDIDKAREFGRSVFGTRCPTIVFGKLGDRLYGWYQRRYGVGEITLSTQIQSDDKQCWQTTIHELAHHIEFKHGTKFNAAVLKVYEMWWAWALSGNIQFPAPRDMERTVRAH